MSFQVHVTRYTSILEKCKKRAKSKNFYSELTNESSEDKMINNTFYFFLNLPFTLHYLLYLISFSDIG